MCRAGAGRGAVGGNRVRLGGDEEWSLRVSGRQASIHSERVVLATAGRFVNRSTQWVVNDGTREYWLERSDDRSLEKAKSSIHLSNPSRHISRQCGSDMFLRMDEILGLSCGDGCVGSTS